MANLLGKVKTMQGACLDTLYNALWIPFNRQRSCCRGVLSIIAYRNTEDAISIADDTNYGLQAYVFSADAKRAREVAIADRSRSSLRQHARARAGRPVRRLQEIGCRSRVRHVWAGGFSRAAGCSSSVVTRSLDSLACPAGLTKEDRQRV